MLGGCMSLELREVWATNKNEGIVIMQMLFKAMGLDKLSKGLSVNVEKRSRNALTLQSYRREARKKIMRSGQQGCWENQKYRKPIKGKCFKEKVSRWGQCGRWAKGVEDLRTDLWTEQH